MNNKHDEHEQKNVSITIQLQSTMVEIFYGTCIRLAILIFFFILFHIPLDYILK